MNIRIGRLGKLLAPGYADCERCKTPWRFVTPRIVPYEPPKGRAAFAICTKCWDEATPRERVALHRARWERTGRSIPDTRRLVIAVQNDGYLERAAKAHGAGS